MIIVLLSGTHQGWGEKRAGPRSFGPWCLVSPWARVVLGPGSFFVHGAWSARTSAAFAWHALCEHACDGWRLSIRRSAGLAGGQRPIRARWRTDQASAIQS